MQNILFPLLLEVYKGAFIEGWDLKGVKASTYVKRHSIRAQEFSDRIESRLKIDV